MDTEAQRKIAQHIAHATNEGWQAMNAESRKYAMGEAELMMMLFERLGYHKLSEDNPLKIKTQADRNDELDILASYEKRRRL